MVDSLRDQLLKAGLKPSPKPVAPAHGERVAQAPASRGTHDKSGRRDASPSRGPGAARVAQRGRDGSPIHAAGKPSPRRADASQEEIDLARAYALRHAQEQREKAAAERIAVERARLRKEQREKAHALVRGKTLNRADAELMRHFEYGGKIRRVHVDAAQLHALNAGELGVIQLDGRYWLVERALAEAVRECAPQHLALLPDPGAADDADEFGAMPDPA
jgi:uncharacterized protein YaiL (DUF2058 family)